jgi:hypothetical protein
MEYIQPQKRKILPFVNQMDEEPQDMILSAISQMISFIGWNLKKAELIEAERRTVATRGKGRRQQENTGQKVQTSSPKMNQS